MVKMLFKVFTKKTCYKCVPVKDKLKASEYGEYLEYVDCDTEEGLQQAITYGVSALPTIISVDENGKELARFDNDKDVIARIEQALGK